MKKKKKTLKNYYVWEVIETLHDATLKLISKSNYHAEMKRVNKRVKRENRLRQ